ncbi:L2 [Leptonychotes weddellii papillomavirus 2]|uniref:Minor capsid protein L2 n=1 Tax=Leptonychotes weddellii papillomavirus 2 TaxID=2077303 RepID=A0A2I8B2M5_9PAPI|nr:L2 [Leptonychotes weddellii papillomavirus 2]AUT11893.1 L2 [Leptonychotes weddellii papillomavirus 2]
MTTLRRQKRASVQDLYKTCGTGDCPVDVRNRVEGTTVADWLLKTIGSLIYTGGLGISTGRGGGGPFGYRPIGRIPGGAGRGQIGPGGQVVTPSVSVSTVGPRDILPVDTLSANSPSVVPLSEGAPSVVIPEGGIARGIEPAGTNLGGQGEPSVSIDLHPISDVSTSGGSPAITSSSSSDIAVIDVQQVTHAPKRVATSSTFANPTYRTEFAATLTGSTSSVQSHILVDTDVGGVSVGSGGEFIELNILGRPAEFDIQEPLPRTSTPREGFTGALKKARELYNKRVRQIRTQNTEFLSKPSRAVQFENPAYEGSAYQEEVTQTFESDLAGIPRAAPDPDFADIVSLGRPRYSDTAEGRVRVSRLGQRGTITTRSGLRIGERVHFYQDISSITVPDATPEAIELHILGEHTGESIISNQQAESIFVNSAASEEPAVYPDELLLDDYNEDFSNSHLSLTYTSRNSTISFPTIPAGTALKPFVEDYGRGLIVYNPVSNDTDLLPPAGPSEPQSPTVIVDAFSYSSDYTLHPSLLRKKRKRKYSYLYR